MSIVIYLSIAGGCALFFLLSLITGGEHDFHHGDLGGSHHGADHHHTDHDGGTSYKEFFSVRSLLLFGTGFGAAGAISSQLGFGFWLIPILGMMSGSLFSWIGVNLFRFLRRQEATTSYSLLELEGTIGHLSIAIPAGGLGEVQVSDIRGEVHFLTACSEDGLDIPISYPVQVVSATPERLVVRKTESLPSAS